LASVEDVLNAISDEKSLAILRTIGLVRKNAASTKALKVVILIKN